MEQSVIKYLQIKIKPLSLSYKIDQVKTLKKQHGLWIDGNILFVTFLCVSLVRNICQYFM